MADALQDQPIQAIAAHFQADFEALLGTIRERMQTFFVRRNSDATAAYTSAQQWRMWQLATGRKLCQLAERSASLETLVARLRIDDKVVGVDADPILLSSFQYMCLRDGCVLFADGGYASKNCPLACMGDRERLQTSAVAGRHCQRGHMLEYVAVEDMAGQYECDICKTDIEERMKYCHECDFSLCDQCASECADFLGAGRTKCQPAPA